MDVFRRFRICWCLVAMFLIAQTPAAGAARQPNVILIMTDDQGYGDFSFQGNSQLQTPALDRLAGESVFFNRFYVSPVCAPTRASLLTGRYHLRAGTWGVAFGRDALHPDEVTIAEALKTAGYRTGMIGKWHNGEHFPSVPHGQGFDEFIGFRGGHWNVYVDPPLEHNGRPVAGRGFITDYFTDEAIRFITNYRNEPFFLYLAYSAPHTPLIVPDEYLRPYQAMGLDDFTAAVYGMIANLDDNIARLLSAVDELHLRDNTIVLFLTDNGPNGRRYNGGLRGIKASVYEGGCRVPLLVRWPGHVPAGVTVGTIAAHIDLFPTIVELCGVPAPHSRPLDGRSLVPLLAGDAAGWTDRALFTHAESPSRWDDMFDGAIRTARYNLVNGAELYDILDDPGEQQNVAGRFPEKVRELRTQYQEWYRDVSTDRAFLPKYIPVGFVEEPVVRLPAPHARFEGSLKFYDMGWPHDWITNWRSTADRAWWDLDIAHPGMYHITLRYRCTEPNTGATVVVDIGGRRLNAVIDRYSAPTPPKTPPRTLGSTNVPVVEWLELPMGRVQLSTGNVQLTVRATDIPGEEAMDLESVLIARIE